MTSRVDHFDKQPQELSRCILISCEQRSCKARGVDAVVLSVERMLRLAWETMTQEPRCPVAGMVLFEREFLGASQKKFSSTFELSGETRASAWFTFARMNC